MKKRIVKVLGFFVLNILFFTILLGFASQSDTAEQGKPASTNFRKQQDTENAAQQSFKNTGQKLIVTTAVAEVAIN